MFFYGTSGCGMFNLNSNCSVGFFVEFDLKNGKVDGDAEELHLELLTYIPKPAVNLTDSKSLYIAFVECVNSVIA